MNIQELYKFVEKQEGKILNLADDNIIVEQRFGRNKDVVREYRILAVFIEDDELFVRYQLIGYPGFDYEAYFKDLLYLSKPFVDSLLKQIKHD